MRVIYHSLEQYVRFLWLLVGLNGLTQIIVVATFPLNVAVVAIFLTGLVNLYGAYGLFKKKSWGWKIASGAAIFTLLLIILFPSVPAFFINLIILGGVVLYRKKMLFSKSSAKAKDSE